jgi:2-amino-4-hydroxy-6-hydroxymethyldihydropteridine diphosphokinase / dihydropteroate synthase
MASALLGLGSNLGDRLMSLRRAVLQLKLHPQIRLSKVSPIYESEALRPVGSPDSWNQNYLNLCVQIETDLAPLSLLALTQRLEVELGRDRSAQRWAPREIDIDILDMTNHQVSSHALTIPHPEVQVRPFCILPLSHIAPNWKLTNHNGETIQIREIAKNWQLQSLNNIPYRTVRTPLSLTELMGIVNLTPDSFSDGGEVTPFNLSQSVEKLLIDGADIIDFGAESTRPGATAIDATTELQRLAPLAQGHGMRHRISVDTRHASTALWALDREVDVINDVSGEMSDKVLEMILKKNKLYLFMHHLGLPACRDLTVPENTDVLGEIIDFARRRIKHLVDFGFRRDQILFDPGIGFGKTPQQNQFILNHIDELAPLKVPILVGHSRKSFLAALVTNATDRDLETAVLSSRLMQSPAVDVLRVHNVSLNHRAMRLQALMGTSQRI